YSKRVLIDTILSSENDAVSFIGQRVVVGGWVKSSREFRKDAPPESGSFKKDLNPVELFLRSIIKALGGGAEQRGKEKFDSISTKPQQPSISILQISDGSGVSSLQVVVDSNLAPPLRVMPTGTCILVQGIIQKPFLQSKKAIEVNAEKILHLAAVDPDTYPLTKTRLPLEALRDSLLHFRPRTTTVGSVMRLRSGLTQATHTFFQENGFLRVQVPVITTTDGGGSGDGDNFTVTSLLHTPPASSKKKTDLASLMQAEDRENDPLNFSKDFFGTRTFLSVSGRLHLESYASALGNVYDFGPRFRSSKAESNKLLAEMWVAEVEMAFTELEDSMECAMDMLRFVSKWLLKNCSEDLRFLSKRVDKLIVERLNLLANASFHKISYSDALRLIEKNQVGGKKMEWGSHLSEEHERYLADDVFKQPLIIYNHPAMIKPFSARLNSDDITAATFDVIIPKVGTLIRGSQNEDRYDLLRKRIKGFERQQQQQYEWYLDLHKHGSAKCSGFGFWFDVFVLYATGLNDVRDAIPFPRSIGMA
ncbi:hypothetical protein M569_03137, partial [Genlisea aurea]